jgi:Sec7-like guanine-nucleotide exchange factor
MCPYSYIQDNMLKNKCPQVHSYFHNNCLIASKAIMLIAIQIVTLKLKIFISELSMFSL